jgi:hypothetical protein
MRLSIAGIFDRGIANKERIALSVGVEAQLSFYVILLSRYNIGRQTIMSGNLASYWFPPSVVKPGDFVILYTGAGANAREPRAGSASTNHFLHWGQRNTIFNDSETCAVLLELTTWSTSPPG